MKCLPTLPRFYVDTQQPVRLTPEDAVTPVGRHKTKARMQIPEVGAEVLVAERVQSPRDNDNR